MFENPRRSRQARNFTENDPKILDLKSSSEQIMFRKLSLGAPDCILHANRVPDPILRGQPCHTWIKNVWCLSSLMTIPRTFMMYLHHINSLESVNDVVSNSVQIFFTVFFLCIVNMFQISFLSWEKYTKKYIFEFMFHRGKFLSHSVKYWFQLLTLTVFLPILGVLRTGHPFSS